MSARAVIALSSLLAAIPVTAALAGSSGAREVPLVPLREAHLDTCERSALVRPVCPRLLPRAGRYASSLYVEPHLDIFNLGVGVDSPARSELNRPPSFLHFVLVAGDVERLVNGRLPRAETRLAVRDGLMGRDRSRPTALGRATWARRAGTVYLMSSWGSGGGMLGDHLVFSWREGGRTYALSLHAWEPLTESVETLRAVVESVPSLVQSRRLRRLSPVRELSLPHGPATRTARLRAPDPGRRAYDVRVVAREGAELEVFLDTPAGNRLFVLARGERRSCATRMPYRICYLRFPRLEAERGGTWDLVVVKHSRPATSVRVDVMFEDR